MDNSFEISRYWLAIKKHKLLYIILMTLAFIFAGFNISSLSDYYLSEIVLAPELTSDSRSTRTLEFVLSKLNANYNDQSGAIYPTLYPDIIKSTDFKIKMLSCKIRTEKSDKEISFYDYIENYRKRPWWIDLISKREKVKLDFLNSFKITGRQHEIMTLMDSWISCMVDKNTMAITIKTIDVDPLVSKILADSASSILQNYITEYQSNKARNDYLFYKKACQKAKLDYRESSLMYSKYCDENRDAITEKVLSKQKALLSEVNQKFNFYYKMISEEQAAENKMQESKPAFMTLKSSVVPLVKAGPNRIEYLLIRLSILFTIITVYVLYKEKELSSLLNF